jgi:hypothetical protein
MTRVFSHLEAHGGEADCPEELVGGINHALGWEPVKAMEDDDVAWLIDGAETLADCPDSVYWYRLAEMISNDVVMLANRRREGFAYLCDNGTWFESLTDLLRGKLCFTQDGEQSVIGSFELGGFDPPDPDPEGPGWGERASEPASTWLWYWFLSNVLRSIAVSADVLCPLRESASCLSRDSVQCTLMSTVRARKNCMLGSFRELLELDRLLDVH